MLNRKENKLAQSFELFGLVLRSVCSLEWQNDCSSMTCHSFKTHCASSLGLQPLKVPCPELACCHVECFVVLVLRSMMLSTTTVWNDENSFCFLLHFKHFQTGASSSLPLIDPLQFCTCISHGMLPFILKMNCYDSSMKLLWHELERRLKMSTKIWFLECVGHDLTDKQTITFSRCNRSIQMRSNMF